MVVGGIIGIRKPHARPQDFNNIDFTILQADVIIFVDTINKLYDIHVNTCTCT